MIVGAAVDDVAAAVVGDANKGIVGCGLLGSAAVGRALRHAIEATARNLVGLAAEKFPG